MAGEGDRCVHGSEGEGGGGRGTLVGWREAGVCGCYCRGMVEDDGGEFGEGGVGEAEDVAGWALGEGCGWAGGVECGCMKYCRCAAWRG